MRKVLLSVWTFVLNRYDLLWGPSQRWEALRRALFAIIAVWWQNLTQIYTENHRNRIEKNVDLLGKESFVEGLFLYVFEPQCDQLLSCSDDRTLLKHIVPLEIELKRLEHNGRSSQERVFLYKDSNDIFPNSLTSLYVFGPQCDQLLSSIRR